MPRLPQISQIPGLHGLPRLPRVPRHVARAPVPLYLRGLGMLIGQRLVAVEYKARLSGRIKQVVLEVAGGDPGRLLVISGHGPKASWYRDITAEPRVLLTSGSLRDAPATARPLSRTETLAELERFRHRRGAAAAARAFGVPELEDDGPLDPALAERLPMVEFTPRAGR